MLPWLDQGSSSERNYLIFRRNLRQKLPILLNLLQESRSLDPCFAKVAQPLSQPTRNPLTRGLPCAASIGARGLKRATIASGGVRERSSGLIGQDKSGFVPV